MVGILAGGGGLVLLIIITLVCCCLSRRKSQMRFEGNCFRPKLKCLWLLCWCSVHRNIYGIYSIFILFPPSFQLFILLHRGKRVETSPPDQDPASLPLRGPDKASFSPRRPEAKAETPRWGPTWFHGPQAHGQSLQPGCAPTQNPGSREASTDTNG